MELRQFKSFDLRVLHYFVALAEELHFARAAERVGINQSPLSKAISLMERELGVRLFVRDRRSTQLTKIGEVLLTDARRILAAATQARLSIVAAAEGRTGRLSIAIGDGLAHPRLSALLRATQVEDPGIDVQMIRCSLSEQLPLLRSGLLDIGIVATPPELHSLVSTEHALEYRVHGTGNDIQAIPVWKDPLFVVLERDHPLADLDAVEWDAMDVTQLVLAGERSTSGVSTRALIDLSGRARRLHFVTSIELLLTLVAAGKGVGLIGSGLAQTICRDDLALRPLRARRPKVATLLLLRGDDGSPLITRFVERARASAEVLGQRNRR